MKQSTDELQKLKGVGKVLAGRLVAAGYDTSAKVAAAMEDDLRKISGINPRFIPAMITQAAGLAAESENGRARKVEELKQLAASLKEKVQEIALSVRDRFKDEIVGKGGRKLEKEIVKVVSSLEKVEQRMESKVKKSGKGLVKAERRLEGLTEAGLKKVDTGLKKARKSLKRIYT
jgi:putative lipoic acid-binding regulatory protein